MGLHHGTEDVSMAEQQRAASGITNGVIPPRTKHYRSGLRFGSPARAGGPLSCGSTTEDRSSVRENSICPEGQQLNSALSAKVWPR